MAKFIYNYLLSILIQHSNSLEHRDVKSLFNTETAATFDVMSDVETPDSQTVNGTNEQYHSLWVAEAVVLTSFEISNSRQETCRMITTRN